MNELYAAAIGGAFAVLGTFIGAWITKRDNQSLEERKLLAEYFGEVFAKFYRCFPNFDSNDVIDVITSLEKVRLFCSPKTEAVILELADALLSGNISQEEIAKLYKKLRELAKDEVCKR